MLSPGVFAKCGSTKHSSCFSVAQLSEARRALAKGAKAKTQRGNNVDTATKPLETVIRGRKQFPILSEQQIGKANGVNTSPFRVQTEVEVKSEPRIALIAMLNKRGSSSAEDETVGKVATKKTNEEPVDQRAALMTMLKNRAPTVDEGKTNYQEETKTRQPSQSTLSMDIEEQDVDPRAALMAMLKKRAPSAVDDVTR